MQGTPINKGVPVEGLQYWSAIDQALARYKLHQETLSPHPLNKHWYYSKMKGVC